MMHYKTNNNNGLHEPTLVEAVPTKLCGHVHTVIHRGPQLHPSATRCSCSRAYIDDESPVSTRVQERYNDTAFPFCIDYIWKPCNSKRQRLAWVRGLMFAHYFAALGEAELQQLQDAAAV